MRKLLHSDEQGVYLPVLAVIATSLIGTIFILSFNTIIMRRSSALLRDVSEQVCRAVADSGDFNVTANVVDAFANAVNQTFVPAQLPSILGTDRFELTGAKLVIPGMSEGVDYSYNTSGGTPKFNAVVSTTSLGLTACPNVTGGCLFQGFNYSASPKPFPAYVLRDNASAYNTFGCEFEGKVKVFNLFGLFDGMSGDIEGDQVTLRTFYAYQRGVDGKFDDYNPSSSSINVADAPGLTIAISTHMQTTEPSDFVLSVLQDEYSPVSSVAVGTSNFSALSANIVTTAVPDRSATVAGSAATLVGPPLFDNSANFAAAVPPWAYSEAYEMAVACMNPAVLVRNMFAATMLQLASRNGYLRGSTEVLHISTQHRRYNSNTPTLPANSNDGALYTNAPVKMVPYGVDLLRPPEGADFQLPYIFYDTGGGPIDWSAVANGTTPIDAITGSDNQGVHPTVTDFGYTFFGRINPWVTGAPSNSPGRSNPEWRKFHALLANQLRVCAHFYQSDSTAANPAILAPQATYYHSAFEPQEMTDFDNSAGDGSVFTDSITTPDQTCPFEDFFEAGCSGLSTNYRQDQPYSNFAGVDAISLVGMLGSTQSCPIRSEVEDTGGVALLNPVDGHTYCMKPEEDIRPDMRGLLQYLNGTIKGVISPGLFPIAVDSPQPVQYFNNLVYSDRVNPDTPVLVITHVAPRSGEIANIQAELDVDRKVVVVFIPYNQKELSLIGNVQEAFRARYDEIAVRQGTCNAGCMADSAYKNVVVVFDPTDPVGNGTGAYCSMGSCTASNFRGFWEDFMDGGVGSGLTVSDRARKVYTDHIVKGAERRY